jgi:hypothetical protein
MLQRWCRHVVEKQAIFILGMGRSGTSALARLLSLCGAYLPEPLLSAGPGNLSGYWEPLEALKLNDEFLFNHGATWYDPTLELQSEVDFGKEEQEAFIGKISAFLEACPAGLMVLKEPRIAALSDFWFEAARRSDVAAKVVIPVRHPDAVAASLAERDKVTFELASALWLKYNLLAERRSRSLPRVFVEYSNLLSAWRKQIGRICEALSVVLTASDETAVDAFLGHDLHHHRNTGSIAEAFGQPWLGRVYAAFSAAARDAPLDIKALDGIFSNYSRCERSFRISLDEFRSRFHP